MKARAEMPIAPPDSRSTAMNLRPFRPLRPADGARMLAVAALYVVSGRLGLTLDAVGGFATVVWAPTGIALAAILLFGYRIWPGVFVGAVVANMLTGASFPIALGIGVGNTLEAVLGVWALRLFPEFRFALDRLVDAVVFLCVCVGAPLVSASIGVASLLLGGVLTTDTATEAWRAWWVGDFIGAVLIAPLILVWRDFRLPIASRLRKVELVTLVVAAVLVPYLVFYGRTTMDPGSFLQAYVVFPVMIWAAARFGQRGAVTSAILTSLTALGGTIAGHGPFVRADLHQSLFALQTFLGVVAASFLVLGASISELQRARDEMRRALDSEAAANRDKAEFIAIMTHELRAPLQAMAGYLELMAKGVQGPLTPDQCVALASVRRNQEHLATLVNDVLNFAFLEAQPIAVNRRRVLVNDALDGVEPIAQPEMRRKRLCFERLPIDTTLAVSADPDRLRQILANFIANAVKFTNDSGSVGVGARVEAGFVRIFVKDDGVGIPPDQVARVFEPFFRATHDDNHREPGVGLGLTIARDLARAMGGEVAIESMPGKGTTASVLLPSA